MPAASSSIRARSRAQTSRAIGAAGCSRRISTRSTVPPALSAARTASAAAAVITAGAWAATCARNCSWLKRAPWPAAASVYSRSPVVASFSTRYSRPLCSTAC